MGDLEIHKHQIGPLAPEISVITFRDGASTKTAVLPPGLEDPRSSREIEIDNLDPIKIRADYEAIGGPATTFKSQWKTPMMIFFQLFQAADRGDYHAKTIIRNYQISREDVSWSLPSAHASAYAGTAASTTLFAGAGVMTTAGAADAKTPGTGPA